MRYQYEPFADDSVFEEFLVDYFNELHQTTHYENYRRKGFSQYGVDVYNPSNKVAIQAKKKSLLRTDPEIVKELLSDLSSTVDKIREFPHPVEKLYFATTTKYYSAVQDHAMQLTEGKDFSITFYCWENIQKEMSGLTTTRKKYYPHLFTKTLPKELTNTPKLNINRIAGRKHEIEKLGRLFEKNNIITIQSIGGAGKTTLAKLYYQLNSDQYNHLIWIDLTSDLKKDIATNPSLLHNLNLTIENYAPVEQSYQAVLSALQHLDGKALIVFDNLVNEEGLLVEEEVMKFAFPKTHILITSREQFASFESFSLPEIELQDAKDLFRNHCSKNADENLLEELVNLPGRNPLMIELLAKTYCSGVGIDLSTFINSLAENNITDERYSIEIKRYSNGQVISEKLYRQILSIFNIDSVMSEPYQLYILLLSSILPPTYTPIEDIFEIFLYRERDKTAVINAINHLVQRGLLQRVEDSIQMHHLIQDVIKIQLPSFAVYIDILNSISRSLKAVNSTYSPKGYRIASYAEFMQTELEGEKAGGILQPLALLRNNLLITYRYTGQMEKAKRAAERLLQDLPTITESGYQDNAFLGMVYHNVGTYYGDINDDQKAEEFFKKSLSFVGHQYSENAIQAYNGLFQLYLHQKRYKEAIEACGKTVELIQQSEAKDIDHILAMIANNFATVYLEIQDYEKASQNVLLAIKLHRECDNKEKNDSFLARYYSNAAISFSMLENHEVAVQFAYHAIEYRGSLNLENDYELLSHYQTAVIVLERAGEHEKAATLKSLIKDIEEGFDGQDK